MLLSLRTGSQIGGSLSTMRCKIETGQFAHRSEISLDLVRDQSVLAEQLLNRILAERKIWTFPWLHLRIGRFKSASLSDSESSDHKPLKTESRSRPDSRFSNPDGSHAYANCKSMMLRWSATRLERRAFLKMSFTS